MGDWAPKRPPMTPAERRQVEVAKKQNRRDREKAEGAAHDARMAEQKRLREEAQKVREARAITVEQMRPAWEMRRTNCRVALLEMLPDVRNRRLAWDNVIISMTASYANAFKSFTDTIQLQQKHEEQMAQVAFSVLAAVSVGGMSVLSTYAQSKWILSEVEDIFVNGLEDAIQVGTDKLMSGLAPSATTKAQPIPLPINYKGELQKVLNDEEAKMNSWIKAGGEKLRSLPVEEFEFTDENDIRQQSKQFWDELDKRFKPVPVDEKAFEKEIEIGLWAFWLGHKLRADDRWFITKWIIGEYRRSIGGPISNRLHTLGIISGFEKAQLESSSDEHPTHVFRRLEKWGATWRPARTFGQPNG